MAMPDQVLFEPQWRHPKIVTRPSNEGSNSTGRLPEWQSRCGLIIFGVRIGFIEADKNSDGVVY